MLKQGSWRGRLVMKESTGIGIGGLFLRKSFYPLRRGISLNDLI